MTSYSDFIASKLRAVSTSGIDPSAVDTTHLFPHQADLARWAARKGRAAIFAATGLGKMRIELTWADAVHRFTGRDVLILAPLAVADQIVREGTAIGVHVIHAREAADVAPGITVCNYERLHKLDPSRFVGIVLDESGRIKHHDTATLTALMEAFRDTPYRLPATATPAPNDWTELGTHAEFIGVCTRAEMLAEYFCHDGGETQTWRLKGHARAPFWRWVSTWGALIRSPADLGYDASRYHLPPLHVEQITVGSDAVPPDGQLFTLTAQTLTERRNARRDSMRHRIAACADMANSIQEPWVIWTELNAEGDALREAIPDAVEIRGSDTMERKDRALIDFAAGRFRVLISKPKICGWGLNWQHCRRIAFVGVTDSWEAYHQAIRRCWRFGQTRPVHAYLFASDEEGAVRANLERKEAEAIAMGDALSRETAESLRTEVRGQVRLTTPHLTVHPVTLPDFIQLERAA